MDRINRVPDSVKAKLVPPLKALFQSFRDNLKAEAEAEALSKKQRRK